MPYDNASGTYTPPQVSGYFPDLYNFGPNAAQYQQRTAKPQFSAKVVDKLPEGEIIAWRLILEDTQGGLNLTQGDFNSDYDRVSSSTLDTRFYKTLVNHQLTTAQASPDLGAGATVAGISFANFNGLLHVGGGGTANSALLSETSTTNPALVAKTFTPNSTVMSLTTVSSANGGGGSPSASYLLVGSPTGIVGQALDISYSAFNLNATVTGLWGAVQTFVNNNTILLYTEGRIMGLSSVPALNSAPTSLLTNVPSGGRGLGLVKLAGAPIRALWLWPFDSTSTAAAHTVGGRLVTTDQEATGYDYLPMGLSRVYGACIIGDYAVVGTDHNRVMFYDGRSAARDLRWNTQREPNSDRQLQCVALGWNGYEIIAEVNSIPTTNSTAGTYSQRWWEAYNLETNSWHQISATKSSISYTSLMSYPQVTVPISANTGFTYSYYEDGSAQWWHYMKLLPYGYNPYNAARQTVGAGSSTGVEFEATGTYTSPYLSLPGLEGAPCMVSKITFMGDVDAGGTSGTPANVSVTAGNLTAQFNTGLARRAQVVDAVDSGEVFYQLQVSITQTRNTGSTRWTPNGLPVMVEGYAWVPKMREPFGWVDDGR